MIKDWMCCCDECSNDPILYSCYVLKDGFDDLEAWLVMWARVWIGEVWIKQIWYKCIWWYVEAVSHGLFYLCYYLLLIENLSWMFSSMSCNLSESMDIGMILWSEL